MKLRYLTLALALAGTLTACEKPPATTGDKVAEAPAMPVDTSEVLATINGTPITTDMLELYQQARQSRAPNDPSSQDRKMVLEEIISLELARQDGENLGVDKMPDVMAQMEQQRRALIASAAFQQQMEKTPITDEALKALYDEKTKGGNEFKARHILVADKEKAEALIVELDKGADFAELAKKNSTGPSGKNGGDLGWFSPKSMVKPFSDALAGMEKGSYTKEPVETQFGWHVILLEDSRESSAPPFEQVKPQLEMMVRNQRVQDYIKTLREAADVQITESAPAPTPAATDKPADEGDAMSDETAEEDAGDAPDSSETAPEEAAPKTGDTANP